MEQNEVQTKIHSLSRGYPLFCARKRNLVLVYNFSFEWKILFYLQYFLRLSSELLFDFLVEILFHHKEQ